MSAVAPATDPRFGTDGTWAVIAGGGTAGHLLPGLAVAAELGRRGVPASAVHFVGSERGIESRLVPAAGHPLTTLPGRGLQRRLTGRNLVAAGGLAVAQVRALRLLRRLRPAVVVGLGGYASVAVGVAALMTRTPLVLTEQNAVPGAANRLLARGAKASAVPFDEPTLPRAVWTGTPVRDEIRSVDRVRDREAARERLGVPPGRRLVVVFGGSLGARRLNEAVLDAATRWRERSDLTIRHITGRRDHDAVAARLADLGDGEVEHRVVAYEDDMASCYAAADLVVARAGASTVAELAVVGCPAILVPLPGAPGDHQSANARALAVIGAAVVLADADCSGERLATLVDELLADPDRLDAMGRAAAPVARPDAAAAIADLVERHARRPAPRLPHTFGDRS